MERSDALTSGTPNFRHFRHFLLGAYPPASPVHHHLRMLESGTVNSDGGQAAAHLVICYWLSVICRVGEFFNSKFVIPAKAGIQK